MKPLRGSNRNASKAPNTKTKGKKTSDEKKRKTEVNKQQDRENEDETGKTTQPKISRKRKAESHSRPSKIKEEENWRQMSVSSLADLEKILDLSILATLARKRADKKEVQEHLNAVKKRFLDHCSTLKVPSHKQKPEVATYRVQEETKKLEAEKQTLGSLEENLRAVVSALEKNEHEMNSLEHQCSVLRNRLQDQEEEAQEIFQKKDSVLNLPPLRPSKDEPTLEAKMRKSMSDSDAETMARRLGEILQNRESLQDAQELLSLAHKQVDELLHPDFNAGITTHCLEVISP
ncbi:centromere protein Q [Periophthalmus magnuspinnatus]|uniref:centromere protein Q n=1 Tax=Periophthalmus magnuspinnatus TaxID=409849 RepID=UPI00145A5B21|nr:centromere protein Q [Periophthalmus magnuspinnatus]